MALPKEVIRERERQAWMLRQQGWLTRQIGAHLGINHGTVCRILARVEKRVLKELSASVERVKVRQTLQLEWMASEALAAWERSKQPTKTQSKKNTAAKPGGGGVAAPGGDVLTQHLTEQQGDTTYLSAALNALADIRRIWGVESVQKVDVAGKDGVAAIALTCVEAVAPTPIAG